MKLTKEQADFILREFDISLESSKDISMPDNTRWDIHDRAFDIEAAELPSKDGDPWNERCRLAVEVCDLMYRGK